MAFLKMRLAFLLVAMFILAKASKEASFTEHKADLQRNNGGRFLPQSCSPACDYRCSQTQYRKPCVKYCNLCCQKCLCVPPGFYGNKQACPCYNNMKNARGGPKCP